MIFGRRSNIALHHKREKIPLKIVGDAGIAAPDVGNGRMIPLVILDTGSRPDIAEFIRVHKFSGPGDVTTQWGATDDVGKKVVLVLSFSRPSELVAIIEFDIVRYGVIVEQILSSRALYLQAGKPGDRLIHNFEVPKIIVEIPDTQFRPIWDKLYHKATVAKLREAGLNRQQAKQVARTNIAEIRKATEIRVPATRA
jgi:hypothetical protein